MKHFSKLCILLAVLSALVLAGCSKPTDTVPQDNKEQTTHEHVFGEWSEWEVVTAATCTEDGSKKRTRTCSCGEVEEETAVIAALGHDYGDWVVTKEATCTEDGEKKHTCKREGCGHFETEVIPAAHDYQGGYCERKDCTDPWEHKDGYKATLRVFTDYDEFIKYCNSIYTTTETLSYKVCCFSFENVNEEINLTKLVQQKTKYENYKVVKYGLAGGSTRTYSDELKVVSKIGNNIPVVLLEPITE